MILLPKLFNCYILDFYLTQ